MKRLFVGIDTSNYTTSAAVCDEAGEVIANIKKPLPVRNGECGLRQSDAVFAHIKNLPMLMDELSDAVRGGEVAAVGVSRTPRDAEGSYMPCFLAGVAASHAFAAEMGLPVYGFSHQNGHIMAAAYSAGMDPSVTELVAFHVSGGTTELICVRPEGDSFSAELIGGTRDLNAGQAIDRVGVMMGLSFPCGAELERLARENKVRIPRWKVSVSGLECNLSGLQNLAAALYKETENPRLVAAAVFDFVGRTMLELTKTIRSTRGDIPVLYAGGVMSNSIIKNMLGSEKNVFFAEPVFASDNAAGVALLCRKKHLGSENG